MLNNVADVAATLGSNVGWYMSQSQLLVVLGPEHAATIAADGLSKADVQRFVFEHARIPLGRLKLGGMWGMHDWPIWMQKVTDDSVMLPQVPSVDDVFVMVAGGSGKHSSVVPNCMLQPGGEPPIDRVPSAAVRWPSRRPRPADRSAVVMGSRPPRRRQIGAWALCWALASPPGRATPRGTRGTGPADPTPGFAVIDRLLVGSAASSAAALEPFDLVRAMNGRAPARGRGDPGRGPASTRRGRPSTTS